MISLFKLLSFCIMNLRDKCNKMLPECAGILHAVSSSNQPGWTDDGRSTDMSAIFNVEADLPGILSFLGSLATNNTRRFEHALSTVCKAKPRIIIWLVAAAHLQSKKNASGLSDVPQLASSDPSSQSSVPSHSGFCFETHLLFEHLYVKLVHFASEPRQRTRHFSISKSKRSIITNSSHSVTFSYRIHSLTHPNRRHSRLFRHTESSLKHTSCSDT